MAHVDPKVTRAKKLASQASIARRYSGRTSEDVRRRFYEVPYFMRGKNGDKQ